MYTIPIIQVMLGLFLKWLSEMIGSTDTSRADVDYFGTLVFVIGAMSIVGLAFYNWFTFVLTSL